MWRFALIALLVCGCGQIELVQGGKKPQEKTVAAKFDAAAAADELAKQAEWSNDAASETASEVVDGILKIASERKSLPDDFIAKVRAAVPGLERRPGTDLSAEDVKKIREVR